jgi:hypothetical protein
MFDRWRFFLPMLPLSISEKKKLGEPKEEIPKNGFEYMNVDDLQIQYV